MVRNTSLIVCLALATLTAGCSNAPAPPPDTRADDVQAVKDIEAASLKDAAAKDADKWASYFAEDASGLFPGDEMLNGKAAIKAAMATYFADPNFSMTLQSTRAMASKGGDMAYSQGTYTMTVTNPKTQKPMTHKGKYLTVYTKQADGSWKAVADTFNSDSPM
ncbi:MAG: SgcJ/EcaC family oxidoreductase [Bryobacteraceae bacterium]